MHRHFATEELYVVLEGRGRIRVDEEALDLGPLDRRSWSNPSRCVRSSTTPRKTRCGWSSARRREGANTLEMSEETLRSLYPEGPRALPRSSAAVSQTVAASEPG